MDPKSEVSLVEEEALKEVETIKDEISLSAFYAKYLAKKGKISLLMGKMREIAPEERSAFASRYVRCSISSPQRLTMASSPRSEKISRAFSYSP